MDLRKEWQQLHQEKFNYSPIKKEAIMQAIYQESNSTIAQLKKRLNGKMLWVIFFISVFLIWMLFSLDQPELLMLIGTFIAIYAVGLLGIWNHYRKIDQGIDYANQPLEVMKKQNRLIKNALNFEHIWSLIAFPLAPIGGLLISHLHNGKSLATAFSDPKFLAISLVCIAIIVPFMHWSSNKMNKKAFGALMEKLQNNIRRMEDLA
jgi:hypothetical protein